MIAGPFYTYLLITFYQLKCLVFLTVCDLWLSGRTACRGGYLAVHPIVSSRSRVISGGFAGVCIVRRRLNPLVLPQNTSHHEDPSGRQHHLRGGSPRWRHVMAWRHVWAWRAVSGRLDVTASGHQVAPGIPLHRVRVQRLVQSGTVHPVRGCSESTGVHKNPSQRCHSDLREWGDHVNAVRVIHHSVWIHCRTPVNAIDIVATASFYLDFIMTQLQQDHDVLEFVRYISNKMQVIQLLAYFSSCVPAFFFLLTDIDFT